MKVHDLLALLANVSPEAEVVVDGCDCNATATAVFVHGDAVHIARAESERDYDADERVGAL